LEWTSDQVLKLAPDASAARSGRDLASARRWAALGCNEQACWGECQGSGSSPYQAQIDLREPAFRCTCPSRKFPCKHGLGLFILYVEHQSAFAVYDPPAWVVEWLAARAKKEQRAKKAETAGEEEPASPVDSAAQAKRLAQREAKVAAGLEELKRWLLDLVRQGLASAYARPYSFWESFAARMVDAQAPGLARAVRDLAGIPASGEGWPDRLLERLGRLLLLVEGYSRISDLPEPTQADLRSLVGWTQDQKELAGRPGVRDRWHVLGRRVEIEDRLKVQRNWLWGQTTGRAALVLSFAAGNQPLDVSLVPGTGIDAELVFFPSSWPLRALVKERHESTGAIVGTMGEPSLQRAMEGYGTVLACNPWIERVPLSLEGVTPLYRSGLWFLRDAEGYQVSLSPRLNQGWWIMACSGGNPISIFGEFDGDSLRPLSLWDDRGFRSLPDAEVS
jgi:hypothetical protein